MKNLDQVVEEAVKLSTPSREEELELSSVVKSAIKTLCEAAAELGIDVDIEVHGSVAHGTWLPGERDVDIFLLFSPHIGKERLVMYGLKIAKRAFPNYIERYSEHPFITALYQGYRIDVVPAARIEDPSRRLTAADRTPLHTRFIMRHLNDRLRGHIRAFKRLLRSTGLYGAELKVGGFSGYLAELLVIYYKSLQELLQNASWWKPFKTVLMLGNKPSKQFNDPLVFIDPVDPARNVAAALTLQRMSQFILLSKLLLRNPRIEVFKHGRLEIDLKEVVAALRARSSHILLLTCKPPRIPPDTLWGELYRSLKGVARLLDGYGFEVRDNFAWTDEKELMVLGYELERLSLPEKVIARGPPVWMHENVQKFLLKHREVWIKGDRLYTYRKRDYTDVRLLLRERIQEASISDDLKESLKMGFNILIDNEALNWSLKYPDLYEEIAKFILKTPWWLKVLTE